AGEGLAEGGYAALPGRHYETPAEIRMLRTLGADLVGMSTALEAIAARHLGAEVLGISLVSNLAAGLAPHGLDHAEVVAAGQAAAGPVGALRARELPGIGAGPPPRAGSPVPGPSGTAPSCAHCSTTAARRPRPTLPTGSGRGSSSAPRACAARSGPARTG